MDPSDKARLLTMARSWSDLANRIEQLGQVAEPPPTGRDNNPTSHHQDPPGQTRG
jgi:hypothetical protein